MRNDTIAAISTARGKGGVAMIRVSGDNATEIINKMFAEASIFVRYLLLAFTLSTSNRLINHRSFLQNF